MAPLKLPHQSTGQASCQTPYHSSFRPLESAELTQVAGGCSQCSYEINPPSSLDAWQIQGGLAIAVSSPHMLEVNMPGLAMW